MIPENTKVKVSLCGKLWKEMENFISVSSELPPSLNIQEHFIMVVVWGVCKSSVVHIFKACIIFKFPNDQMAQPVTVVVGLSKKGIYDYFC